MLESSDIKIVNTIAKLGSISKASEKLNMSQPTLSKRLTRLENVLALDLFHRHSTGMSPTPAANYLISQGADIKDKLRVMERHIEMLANIEGGSLNIGVGPIIEQLYFPQVLLDFIAETTNVSINIQTESAKNMLEKLKKGELDVAIGPFFSQNLPDDFVIKKIDSATIIIVVRANHPLLTGTETKALSIDKILGYPSIAPQIPDALSTLLPKELVNRSAMITVENYAISKSVVMQSDYITGGPRSLFENELASGKLAELPIDLSLIWTSYCVMRSESLHIPAVRKFLDIMTKH